MSHGLFMIKLFIFVKNFSAGAINYSFSICKKDSLLESEVVKIAVYRGQKINCSSF
jgi:hypothetical protein